LALHHFEGQVDGVQRLLIKTASKSILGFDPGYTSLAPDAARYLIAAGVTCIGIDSPSIEKYQGDGTVHRILLSAGLLVIEWLDLSSVPAGKYRMIALPLRLGGLDGSPARVVLWVP
jgi:arylformamidase